MIVAQGELLMNGTMVDWPPRDINGCRIELGYKVQGRSTMNLADEHSFIVGGLRLQLRGYSLDWVCCAYDDDDRYFESWAEDCVVTQRAGYTCTD